MGGKEGFLLPRMQGCGAGRTGAAAVRVTVTHAGSHSGCGYGSPTVQVTLQSSGSQSSKQAHKTFVNTGWLSLQLSMTVPGSDPWQPSQGEGERPVCASEWPSPWALLGRGGSEGAADGANTALSPHSSLLPSLLPPTTGCVCPTQAFSGKAAAQLEASP